MIRQIDVQQESMKQLTFEEWAANIDRFDRDNRIDTQVQYKEDWIKARTDTLVGPDMTRAQAEATARAEIDGQFGLHSPDQYPGGNPHQLAGFGDSNINSSIGSQWRYRREAMIDALWQVIRDSGLPPELLGDVRLNMNFAVVDGPGR